MQSDPPTAKSLAQLVSQMIQFQEDYLGKSAKNPPFTRLPVSNCKNWHVEIFQNYWVHIKMENCMIIWTYLVYSANPCEFSKANEICKSKYYHDPSPGWGFFAKQRPFLYDPDW